ncbi:putative ferredoxin/ferredoxin--NADP reductase [Mycolicibacterium vanbaalenii]|uniref:ferredoxin--NADP(+) reductase n=1 Tax=Mycolicibacterium vanbaalenii TaxID=110539 RepID=A0A5S9R9J0_MYCVN|nr:FAD-dependent oxidoreductase [Mycolicibacterium vanbaalenii]CAA0136387.1 putative ferredoxin/ferredoxin--NADP reductase [Mycolicibacterium vanbaalenii]
MAYVITQNCCKDASCVPVCPVDCIRPAGGPGEFSGTEMLYIDPDACIDCGACMDECPVDAIHYEEDLPAHLERFRQLNAAYFERHPLQPESSPPEKRHGPVESGSLRVAVVGAGPAACYAADELMAIDGVEVDMFERLPTPFGLIRAGVAPDHQHTKSVVDLFTSVLADKRFGCHLNVEIGRDLSHQDLMAHHHAVIYAVGCSASRSLGIPGEDLPGSHPASDVVGWYNGHPDHAHHRFDLSGHRAVIVGNGNVALDVARILLTPPDALAGTDIAEHALEALAHNSIEEVVILGRRGPRAAAFSVGEFLALGHLPGVDVVIDESGLQPDPDDDIETAAKLEVAREYAQRTPTPGNKRVVFRFGCSPTAIEGGDAVTGLQVNHAEGETELIETSLVLRSIGYQGIPVPDLPFGEATGTVPNDRGRVTDATGDPVAGVYATGWIKRGPRGVIGTNRSCAQETVAQLLADFDDGALGRTVADRDALRELLNRRGVAPVDWSGWRAIDATERERGSAASRPRVKLVATEELLAAARSNRD